MQKCITPEQLTCRQTPRERKNPFVKVFLAPGAVVLVFYLRVEAIWSMKIQFFEKYFAIISKPFDRQFFIIKQHQIVAIIKKLV